MSYSPPPFRSALSGTSQVCPGDAAGTGQHQGEDGQALHSTRGTSRQVLPSALTHTGVGQRKVRRVQGEALFCQCLTEVD